MVIIFMHLYKLYWRFMMGVNDHQQGAAVNLMPYTTFRKLRKGLEDFLKTNMMLRHFGGNASKT